MFRYEIFFKIACENYFYEGIYLFLPYRVILNVFLKHTIIMIIISYIIIITLIIAHNRKYCLKSDSHQI